MRVIELLAAPDRLDRLRLLWEVRAARYASGHQPADPDFPDVHAFADAVRDSGHPLAGIEGVLAGGEAEDAVTEVVGRFRAFAGDHHDLPFPAFYNADPTHALLSYALVRHLGPEIVIESGVGYGVTTALVLSALERNGVGHLTSIDLPPLAAASGAFTGILVPEELRPRWTLHLGSSRKHLDGVLARVGRPGVFLSDSANVFALERYELETVLPHLVPGGVALFNNIPKEFQEYAATRLEVELTSIEQVDKAPMVTGLLWKRDGAG
ncbi:MAG TPA: class I SAM-dependent methyltransferase [Acidimicrobiia bacterium]